MLANGPLTLQALGAQIQILVPGLHDGPPQRLPLSTRPWPALATNPVAAPAGLAIVARAAVGETCPASPAALEAWLARHAPEHRLACAALVPDLAVLWLPAEGLQPGTVPQAWLRCGDGWAALRGRASRSEAWRPVVHFAFPGAGMRDTYSDADSDPPEAKPAAVDRPGSLRHSRLAAALGAPVLGRLQRSQWLVVGCDTTGSMLAHSLARMGVNLLLLDPATLAAQSLDGDLPPLHEGQAKPVALQHLLRGLLRPGARCDARALTVASPAAGSLLAAADGLLCCTASADARRWANAWSQALLKPLLSVRTGAGPSGCEAELQVSLPGSGCLACSAGAGAAVPTGATPRSWQGVAAHALLRLLEHLYDGRVQAPLHRRLSESTDGALVVQDRFATRPLGCPACTPVVGRGLAAVLPAMQRWSEARSA